MPEHDVTTIEIHLRDSKDGYYVHVHLGDGSDYEAHLAPDVLSWETSRDAPSDGQRLFDALFSGRVREAWGATRGCCRIRLWLDTQTPELHRLPWELLYDGKTFIAAGDDTPFSRYLSVDKPLPAALSLRTEAIRVLVAIANPVDLDQYHLVSLDVASERQRLESSFSVVPSASLQLAFLDATVTLERLETALREQRPHILHLVAHGTFSGKHDQAVLYLQEEDSNVRLVTDVDFSGIFHRLGQERPRLVFLSACEGAARSTVDAFAGLAPRLVQAGIPAVVAMQDTVAITTTRELTSVFYGELFRHGEVDRALNRARSLLLTGKSPDADVPVLLMRLKDGRLWNNPAATRATAVLQGAVYNNQVYWTTIGGDVQDRISPALFCRPPLPKGFIGRECERAVLLEVLKDPDKTVIGVTGISGIGKTYLAAWFYQEIAALNGYQPLWVDCRVSDVNLKILLRDLAIVSRDERLLEQIDDLSIDEVVHRYMEPKQVVLFLEDYHCLGGSRRDDDLNSLIRQVAKYCRKAKITLIGRVRPSIFDDPGLRAAVCHIEMEGLDRKHTRQYLEMPDLTDDQASVIWEKCAEGMPIAMHIFKTNLSRRPLSELLALPLWGIPNARSKWLNLIVGDLSQSGLECLQAASVFPGLISFEALKYVLSGSNLDIAIDELLDRMLLDHDIGSGAYSFHHTVIQEYIYNEILASAARVDIGNRLLEYYVGFIVANYQDYGKLQRESVNILGVIRLYLREKLGDLVSLPLLLQSNFSMEKVFALQITVALADLAYYSGDLTWARQLYSQVLELFSESDSQIISIKVLIQLAFLDRDEGDQESAINRLQKVISVGRLAGKSAQGLLARACEVLGGWLIGEREASRPLAEKYLREGLLASRESGYSITTAGIVNNLIRIYLWNKEFEKAYELYNEEREFLSGIPLAIVLSSMVDGLMEVDRLDEAWHCIQEARRLYEESHNTGGIAYTWRLQGWWHSKQHTYELAEECFQTEERLRRLDMKTRGEKGYYLKEALRNHHSFYLQTEQSEKMELCRSKYQLLSREPDEKVAEMLGHEAIFLISRGNYHLAAQYCCDALDIYQQLNNLGGVAWIKGIEGDISAAKGNFMAARQLCEE